MCNNFQNVREKAQFLTNGFIKLLAILAIAFAPSCATRYRFISQPEGARVFHKSSSSEALLGTTPAQIEKSTLPSDQPFFVVFKKPGFKTLEILISPTDQSLTTIFAELSPDKSTSEDPELKRTRKILQLIFQIQEHAMKNQMTDALALIKQLESEEPQLAEVFMLKGSIYCALNDLKQCSEAWEKTLSLDPSLDALRVRLKGIQDLMKEGK